MPFSKPEVMSAFICEEDYVGIHADLAAIEPCILAYYSGDPSLMKVYGEGKGDIYLDLALEVFPDNAELRAGYDAQSAEIKGAKERFKNERAICKTLHLALSYTGSHITIAKNLVKQGYPTTKYQAMTLVKRYWQKFARVKLFDRLLHERYDSNGMIRNIVGRIIVVPEMYKKDLLNRLIQSSAHDVLRLWVMQIVMEFETNGVQWKPWLPDIHDSTTFMIKKGQEELATWCYNKALQQVENKLNLTVPLKMELKFCHTLAGLKEKE